MKYDVDDTIKATGIIWKAVRRLNELDASRAHKAKAARTLYGALRHLSGSALGAFALER